jgi:hypothetical protein
MHNIRYTFSRIGPSRLTLCFQDGTLPTKITNIPLYQFLSVSRTKNSFSSSDNEIKARSYATRQLLVHFSHSSKFSSVVYNLQQYTYTIGSPGVHKPRGPWRLFVFVHWHLIFVGPHLDHVSHHPSEAYNSKMGPIILENLCTPAMSDIVFLISNVCRVLNVVCFFLGNSPASEFYMPTFRNTLFHLHRRIPIRLWRLNFICRRFGTICSIFLGGYLSAYEDGTECSETSAYQIQTPFHLHRRIPTRLWRWKSVPKRRHIKFRRREITQKKAYNI